VPLATLATSRELPKNKALPLVVVCPTGSRAPRAVIELKKLGFANISVLAGGLNAWRAAGYQVEQGEPKWTLERQVRLTAGAAVVASIATSLWAPKARFLAGAVGGGLVFAAVTDTCAMGNILSRLPYNRGSRADIDAAAHRLAA